MEANGTEVAVDKLKTVLTWADNNRRIEMVFQIHVRNLGANRVLCMKFRTESTDSIGVLVILYEISHRIDGFDGSTALFV